MAYNSLQLREERFKHSPITQTVIVTFLWLVILKWNECMSCTGTETMHWFVVSVCVNDPGHVCVCVCADILIHMASHKKKKHSYLVYMNIYNMCFSPQNIFSSRTQHAAESSSNENWSQSRLSATSPAKKHTGQHGNGGKSFFSQRKNTFFFRHGVLQRPWSSTSLDIFLIWVKYYMLTQSQCMT